MRYALLIVAVLGVCLGSSLAKPRMDPYHLFGKRSLLSHEQILTLPEHAAPIVAGYDSRVGMSSYPSAFVERQDLIISWSGVANATAKDYIIASCGPVKSLSDYIDALPAYANSSDPAIAAGAGSVQTPPAPFLRCDFVFTYISAGPNGEMIALANVTVPSIEGPNVPKQGHIAFTSNYDEMMVSYTSGSNENAPSVRYGLSSGNYEWIATGDSRTYQASDMCDNFANVTSQQFFRNPGWMHRVLLTGLSLDTMYFYQYGNDIDGWSEERFFTSHPGTQRRVAKFIAYADMGIDPAPSGSGTALRSALDIANGYKDFLIHFGDISYALGQGHVWDIFMSLIEPYATKTPYMVSIGNHEYDHLNGGSHDPSGAAGNGFHPKWGNMGSDSSGECGVPVYNRFTSPDNGLGIFWYSFSVGPVHVIQMSSEHDWTRGSKQYTWMEADLAGLNRTETPWVILTSHRMMYTTQLQEWGDYNVSQYMKIEMDDLINQYAVNLMLVGHQHSYERSCPVYKQECVPDGKAPVHIIVGSAGAGLETGGFSSALGNWSVSHTEQWGYCRVTATDQELIVQFVLNADGSVYDEVTLTPWTPESKRATLF